MRAIKWFVIIGALAMAWNWATGPSKYAGADDGVVETPSVATSAPEVRAKALCNWAHSEGCDPAPTTTWHQSPEYLRYGFNGYRQPAHGLHRHRP